MKKKQVIGIVIAAASIILTGIIGIISNVVANNMSSDVETNSQTSSFFELFSDINEDLVLPIEDFVGVVNVVGEIGPSEQDSIWTETLEYDHDLNIKFVDAMMHAENNKGILLYVNSPGGTVYESDELYLKLMQYKSITGRPIWAYFASEACSGGYYISMAADKIYANRNCLTGSIGVIMSMLNAEGLYEKIGIEEINIASGDNKAMGSMGSEPTQEQFDILQSIVDESYEQFIDIICEGRGIDKIRVKQLADGRVYTAKQALDNNLIDKIGLYEDFKKDLEEEWNLDEYVTYYNPQEEYDDMFTSLFAAISNLVPRNEAEIGEKILNSRNGVLMYYAG